MLPQAANNQANLLSGLDISTEAQSRAIHIHLKECDSHYAFTIPLAGAQISPCASHPNRQSARPTFNALPYQLLRIEARMLEMQCMLSSCTECKRLQLTYQGFPGVSMLFPLLLLIQSKSALNGFV